MEEQELDERWPNTPDEVDAVLLADPDDSDEPMKSLAIARAQARQKPEKKE